MSQIPYYDDADGRLLAYVSKDTAERYFAAGTARPIRAKNGRIVRLYAISRERVFGTAASAIAATSAAASKTIRLVRGNGALIREHKSADGWSKTEAYKERSTQICNRHQEEFPGECICDWIAAGIQAGDERIIEAITGRREAPPEKYAAETWNLGVPHTWEISAEMSSAATERNLTIAKKSSRSRKMSSAIARLDAGRKIPAEEFERARQETIKAREGAGEKQSL